LGEVALKEPEPILRLNDQPGGVIARLGVLPNVGSALRRALPFAFLQRIPSDLRKLRRRAITARNRRQEYGKYNDNFDRLHHFNSTH